MRPLLVLSTLLLAILPASALAHNTHDACGNSRTILEGRVVHVDLYQLDCFGVAAYFPIARCALPDVHLLRGVHTPVLHDGQCETGVIVEILA